MSALLNNTVTDALALALFHSLWQFTLIGLLVFALTKLLKTAHQRHFAYLASLLTCGFIFGVTAYWYYEPPVIVHVPKGPAYLDLTDVHLSATRAAKGKVYTLLPYLVPVYLIGLSIIAMRTIIDLNGVRQIRKQLFPATGKISEQFNKLTQQFHSSAKLQLHLSETARSAMTIGLFRPLIVFPIGLMNQLSTEETEAILLHEIAHLLRKDHWWNAVQVLIGNLFFYHPAIFWLCQRIDAEREYACDDYVVARLDRRVYAQSLLTTAQFSLTHNNQFIMQAQGKSEFTQRIQRLFLTEQDQHRRPRIFIFVPVFLLIVAGFQFSGQEDTKKVLLSNTDIATLESENAPLLIDTFPPQRNHPVLQKRKEGVDLKVANSEKEQSTAPHANPMLKAKTITTNTTPIHADLFGVERTYENTVVIINGKRQMGNTLGDLSKLSIESMNVIKGEDRVTAKGYSGYPAMIELVVNKPGTHEPMEITEPSVNELLQGKKAGVEITNTEKRTIKLNSRNVRDLEDKVLYLLDGEVIKSGTIDDIDPATISSVEVVKGVDQIAELGYGEEYTGAVMIFTSKKSKRKFERKQKAKSTKKKEMPYYEITGELVNDPNTVFILNGKEISKEQLFKTRQKGEVVTFITITERSTLEKKGYDSSVSGVIEIVEEK